MSNEEDELIRRIRALIEEDEPVAEEETPFEEPVVPEVSDEVKDRLSHYEQLVN